MKSLENIYTTLRNNKLLNKFKDYKSLEIYFIEKPSGKNITKFHETLMKSAIDYKPSRADFFENIIIPLLIKNKLNENKIIEYVFLCLKDDGNLTQLNTLESFINSISKEENFIKFMLFLQKTEYIINDKKNEIKNVFEKYNSFVNERLNFLKKTHVIESVDILLKESDLFILSDKIDKFLIKLFDSLYNYIEKDCKAEIKNKDFFVDLLKKINNLILVFNKHQKLSECSKIIKKKSLIIKQKIDEEKSILNSFYEIESITKKIPQELFCKDLSKLITAKNNQRAYSDFISIGNLIFGKNEVPILINLFNKSGLFFETTENEENYLALIQNIVLRLLFSLPRGHVHVKIIDEDYGRSFQHLLNLPKEIIGSNVYYDDSMVLKLFDEAKKRDSDIVFNKLKSSYNNLIEYNKVNEVDFVPIEIYVISNFPSNFNDTFIRYISNQIKKGSRTGSYYIFTQNSRNVLNEKNATSINEILSLLPSIKFDIKSINYIGKSDLLDKIKSRFDDEVLISDNLITQYFNQKFDLTEKQSSAIRNEDNGNSSEEIKIQIGTKANQVKLYLTFGNSSGAYHGIVCGTTGSGKSVLLHQIIIEGSKSYTPNELQFVLLDYKEGTGFKVYKDLPHAKIIAVDADIDFGLETLLFLINEMKLRAELFKKHDTKDLPQFRKKTGKNCPRILVVIDEFQVLLNGNSDDYEKSKNIQKLIEDIVRLGRSFGIHLLLATQTPSGVKWTSGTIENISMRIGLRMSTDAENYLFKHSKPIASQFTERFGKAVYNDKSGIESESVIFDVINLDEDKIPLYVQEAVIDTKKDKTYPKDRTVYEGEKYIDITLPKLSDINWSKENSKLNLEIGIEAKINPSAVYLTKDIDYIPASVIIGSNPSAKKDILELILNEYISKSAEGAEIFIYSDGEDKILDIDSKLKTITNKTITASKNGFIEYLVSLRNRLKTGKAPQRLLFILDGINNLGKINDIALEKNTDFTSSEPTVSKFLNELLSLSQKYNVSFICFNENKFESDKNLGLKISSFDNGISVGKFNNKIKSSLTDSIDLKENQAVIYSKKNNSELKLNLIKINHG